MKLTKPQVDEIISRYGEGKIGDVFQEIMETTGTTNELKRIHELTMIWRNCFYSKTLQEIADKGWEDAEEITLPKLKMGLNFFDGNSKGVKKENIKTLKSPAKELFLFLDKLLK